MSDGPGAGQCDEISKCPRLNYTRFRTGPQWFEVGCSTHCSTRSNSLAIQKTTTYFHVHRPENDQTSFDAQGPLEVPAPQKQPCGSLLTPEKLHTVGCT